MNFWGILFIVMILLTLGAVFYLASRFRRFSFMQGLCREHKVLSWTAGLIPTAACGLFAFINVWTAIVVLIHLLVIWGICDFIAFVIRKISGKKRRFNIEGAAAILLTTAYLSVGWYNAFHVDVTDYSFTTSKDIGDGIRIVGIADSHLGITLDGDTFRKEMAKVQQAEPDIVIVAGDFVDDDSTRSDMIKACSALGDLKTTYGVYFIYGNHDKGYFEYRDFNSDELEAELLKNKVTILKDQTVEIGEHFLLAGRLDRTFTERLSAQELLKDADRSKYIIMLDHQPNDYANEAAAAPDLVFSGHTHGGPLIPAGQIGLLLGLNDRVYGTEKRENTDFVVTSGISGWAIPFKTGTFSEITVMDIRPSK